MGFVSSFTRSSLVAQRQRAHYQNACCPRSDCAGLRMSADSPKKGLFGRLKESILKPLVTVPGGGDGEILECVFCKGSGVCDCDACKGTGKDALGTCLMCGGKTHLTCTVCSGVGMVDRIRRGGTDDKREYLARKKK